MYNYIKNLKDNTPLNDELYFKSLVNGAMSFDVFKNLKLIFMVLFVISQGHYLCYAQELIAILGD